MTPRPSSDLDPHRDWLSDELLAVELELAPDASLADADQRESATLDGVSLELSVARA